MTTKDVKSQLIRQILLLQEFYLNIVDRKDIENQVVDHLLHMSKEPFQREKKEIADCFLDKQLLYIRERELWYANIVNYLVCKTWLQDFNSQKRKRLFHECKFYRWDEPFLYKLRPNQIFRRCVPEYETKEILAKCHEAPYGRHFRRQKMAAKILQSGYFGPTLFQNARSFVVNYDWCQRTRNISHRNEMPQQPILEFKQFDVQGIDFMGPFLQSNGNIQIFLVVDYVSKQVEAIS